MRTNREPMFCGLSLQEMAGFDSQGGLRAVGDGANFHGRNLLSTYSASR